MKVLVTGSGGKTHALIAKLAESERVSKIYSTFTNAAIEKIADFVDIRENDADKLYEFIKENGINLTIVDSLTAGMSGLTEKLREEGLTVFGPDKNSCKIQTGRGFAKKFMHKHKVPTPQFGVFDKETQALAYARSATYPQVVKFDSRVPGSGYVICNSFNEAKNVISFCLKNLYKPVVMENYVPGRMLSFQVITDGYDAVPLPTTYVYKKAEDGNFGANTDGMGAYSPLSYVDVEMQAKIAEKIFFPIIDGLNAEKMSYAGFLRATIVIDEKNNPQLLGINVVSGDCELQTTLPLLADDIFDIMMFTVNGALADSYEMFKIREDYSVCVSFVSDGYPQEYKKGFVIEGLDEIDDENTVIYHACTKKNVYNETLTDGGKVLSVVSTAATLGRARELAYEAVDLISFENMRYRKDIAAEKVACKMDI